MPIIWSYRPPTVDASAIVHAALPVAERAAAEVILAASQPLVPVDTGQLRDSGHIESTADAGTAIVYDAVAEDGFPYGIRVHEDLTMNHPNGGQAKFLEQPMHDHAAEAMAAAGTILLGVIGP